MGSYILRRVFQSLLTIWGAVTFLFFIFWIIPGDLASTQGDTGRGLTDAVKANLNRLYGYDDPLFMQYLKSLRRLVTFDFGNSATNRDIGEMLGEAIGASARLSFWGILLYTIGGIVMGVFAAVHRNGIFDRLSGFFTILLNALPPFVMGIALQIVFGVIPFQKSWPQWTRFPVQWDQSAMKWFAGVFPTGHTWKFLLLPVVTIASVELASMARGSRTVMLEVLRADYLRTARAKGLSSRKVIFKHGLRNAMIPIITMVGVNIPNTFGYAILTETVWNIPGLGGSISQAVQAQDSATTLAFVSVIVIITVTITLLVDISYGLFDPRVKVEG